MTETEQDILRALHDLEDSIRSMPTANPKPNLVPLFARLDKLTGQLPADSSPELLHYMGKKSYEKARFWLEGRREEIARGGCRHD